MIEPTIQLLKTRQENNRLRRERKELVEEIENLRNLVGIGPLPKTIQEPTINKGKTSKFLLLSDIHLEKVKKRELEKMFYRLLDQLPEDVEVLNIFFLGDLINNVLETHKHEDLLGNRVTPNEAVEELLNNLIWFYKELRDQKIKINTYAIQGNHGRQTRLELYEQVGRLNIDTHIIRLLSKAFPHEYFYVSNWRHDIKKIDSTKIRFTHAIGSFDDFNSIKKEIFKLDMQKKADITVAGHNHCYLQNKNCIINGSWSTNDQYSVNKGFSPQEPCQVYFEVENKKISLVKLLYI